MNTVHGSTRSGARTAQDSASETGVGDGNRTRRSPKVSDHSTTPAPLHSAAGVRTVLLEHSTQGRSGSAHDVTPGWVSLAAIAVWASATRRGSASLMRATAGRAPAF